MSCSLPIKTLTKIHGLSHVLSGLLSFFEGVWLPTFSLFLLNMFLGLVCWEDKRGDHKGGRGPGEGN